MRSKKGNRPWAAISEGLMVFPSPFWWSGFNPVNESYRPWIWAVLLRPRKHEEEMVGAEGFEPPTYSV